MQTKIIALITVSALLSCTSNEKSTPASDATAAAASSESSMKAANTSGYAIEYDTKWSVDNAANAEKVLAMYKDWDNNNLANVNQHMADSIFMVTWDGSVMQGTRDEVMKTMTEFRSNFTSVKSVIHGLIGTKALDKNEDWVLIYAKEYHTDKAGKSDSTELQEAWCFNKDGKLIRMYQYGQMNPPPAKK
jgi:hypothetical protein